MKSASYPTSVAPGASRWPAPMSRETPVMAVVSVIRDGQCTDSLTYESDTSCGSLCAHRLTRSVRL